MSDRWLRLRSVAVAARLARAGLVLPGEGNLSVRSQGGFLVTVAGADLSRLAATDLIPVEAGDGPAPPGASSEVRLHRAVYRRCRRVGAVVHAHPPAVLALAARGRAPDSDAEYHAESGLGRVVMLPPVPPGGGELAEAVSAAVVACDACVLQRHGAVTVGPDLETAGLRMMLLERAAGLGLHATLPPGPS